MLYTSNVDVETSIFEGAIKLWTAGDDGDSDEETKARLMEYFNSECQTSEKVVYQAIVNPTIPGVNPP